MKKVIVTGAFGYSGKYISKQLLAQNYEVSTLTNSKAKKEEFENKIKVYPLDFNQEEALIKALQGNDVLINTYWVRFNHKKFNQTVAVENTKKLFDAAIKAGVKKIIHVSITNPDIHSNLQYFKGKAELEAYLQKLPVVYSIIRPAVLFGHEDILINNIAWMLRHMPIMGVFGKGDYKLQPIHVEDFADLIVNQISDTENRIINAIGQETYSYKDLVLLIRNGLTLNKKVINVHPRIGYWVGKIVSLIQKDVTITYPEIKGLMDNLLYVNDQPQGKIKLSEWLGENKNTLGTKYANELKRRV